MSTTYYAIKDKCLICNRREEICVLGTMSYPYRFLFKWNKEVIAFLEQEPDFTYLQGIQIYLDENKLEVQDEYGRYYTPDQFVSIVKNRQGMKYNILSDIPKRYLHLIGDYDVISYGEDRENE